MQKYIILIAAPQKLQCFISPEYFVSPKQLVPQIKNLVKQCWPGPLTVIFKAKQDLPDFLKSEHGTVAIRCPKHDALIEILKQFGGLFSTSANKSCDPAPSKIDDVNDQIAAQVKYLVDDKIDNKIDAKQASTIIDVSRIAQSGQVQVVRYGAYSVHDLEKILGKNVLVEKQ